MNNFEIHTPGPWLVTPNYPNGMTAICRHDGKGWRQIGVANSAPDARLMAAAPELLAALIEANEALEDEGFEADGRYRRIILAAIAKGLISKSEGEQE